MSNRQSIAIVAAALVISLAVVLRPLEARGPAMIAAERIASACRYGSLGPYQTKCAIEGIKPATSAALLAQAPNARHRA